MIVIDNQLQFVIKDSCSKNCSPLPSSPPPQKNPTLGCLVEWIFGRKEKKKGEKMRKKIFLEGVWLGGGEGKEMVFGSFLPGSYKNFSPQNGEKTEGRKCASAHGRKCLCALAHGLIPRHLLFSFFLFFLFFFNSVALFTIVFFHPLAHTKFFCQKNVTFLFYLMRT